MSVYNLTIPNRSLSLIRYFKEIIGYAVNTNLVSLEEIATFKRDGFSMLGRNLQMLYGISRRLAGFEIG